MVRNYEGHYQWEAALTAAIPPCMYLLPCINTWNVWEKNLNMAKPHLMQELSHLWALYISSVSFFLVLTWRRGFFFFFLSD